MVHLIYAEKVKARQQVVADECALAVEGNTTDPEAKDVCPKENLTKTKRAEHMSLFGAPKVKVAHQVMFRLGGVLKERVELAVQRGAALTGCKDRLVSAEETMAMQQVEAGELALATETRAAGMKANIACLDKYLVESKRTRLSFPQVRNPAGRSGLGCYRSK